MVDDLSELKEKLKKVGQEHIISFWNELSENQQDYLATQINQIDFVSLKEKFEQSKINEYYDESQVEPIPYRDSTKISEEERERYIKTGEEIVKKGEIAVISMAGGQRYKTWIPWTKSYI